MIPYRKKKVIYKTNKKKISKQGVSIKADRTKEQNLMPACVDLSETTEHLIHRSIFFFLIRLANEVLFVKSLYLCIFFFSI